MFIPVYSVLVQQSVLTPMMENFEQPIFGSNVFSSTSLFSSLASSFSRYLQRSTFNTTQALSASSLISSQGHTSRSDSRLSPFEQPHLVRHAHMLFRIEQLPELDVNKTNGKPCFQWAKAIMVCELYCVRTKASCKPNNSWDINWLNLFLTLTSNVIFLALFGVKFSV